MHTSGPSLDRWSCRVFRTKGLNPGDSESDALSALHFTATTLTHTRHAEAAVAAALCRPGSNRLGIMVADVIPLFYEQSGILSPSFFSRIIGCTKTMLHP